MNYAAGESTFLSNSDFFINGTTNCNNSLKHIKVVLTALKLKGLICLL